MEAARTYVTSVGIYLTTRQCISEDSELPSFRMLQMSILDASRHIFANGVKDIRGRCPSHNSASVQHYLSIQAQVSIQQGSIEQ
jgi:hypothetical protein